MSAFAFGPLTIDAHDFAVRSAAVLGIRDSGKTYTATLLAERLFDAGVPFIAFDPIGVWRFLRVPGAGNGYPVVVAGGQDGDLPLTVAGAPEIVRAAMKGGVSIVIDLFSMELSKADWRKIVTSCVKVLLHENQPHGLRHVFLEEAAEFIPQKINDGIVYAEVEKLARMGGNSRLGLTIINQRAEEVNKAVLELCDNLFLHRQKGRNSLTALSKWLDVANVKNPREIIESLSTLPTGECWAWLHSSERPIRVKVPAKNSLHPDRRATDGEAHLPRQAVEVDAFVETIKAALEKAKDGSKSTGFPKSAAGVKRAPDPEEIAAAEQRGYERGLKEAARSWHERLADLPNVIAEMSAVAGGYAEQPKGEIDSQAGNAFADPTPPLRKRTIISSSSNDAAKRDMGAERRILAVLARAYPGGMTEAQWAVAAGMKRSGGTWGTYKSRLRVAGAIKQRDGQWVATEDGLLVGSAMENFRRCRRITRDGYPTPRARRKIMGARTIRHYVKHDDELIPHLKDIAKRLRRLPWPESLDERRIVFDLIEAQRTAIRAKHDQAVRRLLARIDAREIKLKPYRILRQEKRKNRRRVIKAAAIAAAVLGTSAVSAFARGAPVEMRGEKIILEARPRVSIFDVGHGGCDLTIKAPDGAALGKLCCYFDQTPVLDQLAAFALHIAAGEEDTILETGNVYSMTEAGAAHPLIASRKKVETIGDHRRDRIFAEAYFTVRGRVYEETLAVQVFGRDSKKLRALWEGHNE